VIRYCDTHVGTTAQEVLGALKEARGELEYLAWRWLPPGGSAEYERWRDAAIVAANRAAIFSTIFCQHKGAAHPIARGALVFAALADEDSR